MRQMAQNGAKIVVFQRELARPPGRNPSPLRSTFIGSTGPVGAGLGYY